MKIILHFRQVSGTGGVRCNCFFTKYLESVNPSRQLKRGRARVSLVPAALLEAPITVALIVAALVAAIVVETRLGHKTALGTSALDLLHRMLDIREDRGIGGHGTGVD